MELENYNTKVNTYIKEQQDSKYKGLQFTQEEELANIKFVNLLKQEKKGKPSKFYFSNMARYEDEIYESQLYKLLRKMPKGSMLHLHEICCMDVDFLIEGTIKHPTTYVQKGTGNFAYYSNESAVPEGYVNLLKDREASEDKVLYDQKIRDSLVLTRDEADDKDTVWSTFQNKVTRILGIQFKDHRFKNCVHFLKKMADQGMMNVELRTRISACIDEQNKMMPLEDQVQELIRIQAEVQKEYPNFSLVAIPSSMKRFSKEMIKSDLKQAIIYSKKYPDLIQGFDLVMEEDACPQTREFLDIFEYKNQLEKEYGIELPFFMHGGETLSSYNENLYDLILLNSKRIGHGINLSVHSNLLDTVKQSKTSLEICPISNQILGYCYDLRNHPARTFLNYGVNITINSDDPGIFGYKEATLDFYASAVALEFNLKDFKLCCYNSIINSSLSEIRRNKLLSIWEKEWESWVQQLNQTLA